MNHCGLNFFRLHCNMSKSTVDPVTSCLFIGAYLQCSKDLDPTTSFTIRKPNRIEFQWNPLLCLLLLGYIIDVLTGD